MQISHAERGVCGDPDSTSCDPMLNAIVAGLALTVLCCAVWIARAPGRAALAAWMMASSMLRLIWGVPVVGDYYKSLRDVEQAAHTFEWLYTRQVYVPAELGILNMGLYCIIRPYPPTAYAASAYWLTSVWLAVQYWNDATAPLYTLHDVAGLFMGLLWFQAGPPRAGPPIKSYHREHRSPSASGPTDDQTQPAMGF